MYKFNKYVMQYNYFVSKYLRDEWFWLYNSKLDERVITIRRILKTSLYEMEDFT